MASLLQRAMDNAPAATQMEQRRLLAETQAQLKATRADIDELQSALASSKQRETEQAAKLVEAENSIKLLGNELARYVVTPQIGSSAVAQSTHNAGSILNSFKKFRWEFCGLGVVGCSALGYASDVMSLAGIPLSVMVPGVVFLTQRSMRWGNWRFAAGMVCTIGGLGMTFATIKLDEKQFRDFEPPFVVAGEAGQGIYVLPYKYESWSRVKRFQSDKDVVRIPASISGDPARKLTCIQYRQGDAFVLNKDLSNFDKSKLKVDLDPYRETGDCPLIRLWRAGLFPTPGG